MSINGSTLAIHLRAVDWSILVGYELLAGPQRDISAEEAAARLRDVL